jgi:hypothetical protein
MQTDIVDLEQDLSAIGEPFRHEVLDHLLLPVDGDALAHQFTKVDVVERAIETEMDAVVGQPLALHALADAGVDQQIARPLLDQAGADAALDIVAVAVLDDDGLDALEMQKVREHEAGGPGADDPNLCTHVRFLG